MAAGRSHRLREISSHSESCDSESLRRQIATELNKNPLLTAKPLCRLLGLDYRKHGKYVANTRTFWKYHHRNEQGSKCSSHGWRGWCYLPSEVAGGIRTHAVDVGWLTSRARNRWLLWKDRLGRLQWFETGRVNLYVRKPANLGRAYQLICNAFSFTGLITDVKVLERVFGSVRFKGAHFVFPVGQRLPRLTIDLFAKSNGMIVKVGDRTHPDSIELIAMYPDWAERNERLFEELLDVLRGAKSPGVEGPRDPRSKNLGYVA